MKLRQPNCDPALQLGVRIQCTFRCANDDDDDDEIVERHAGKIMKVSNGRNIENPGKGNVFCRKDSAVEVEWDDDRSKVEGMRFSIVEIKKTLFNRRQEFG